MDESLEQYKPAEKLELRDIKEEFPKAYSHIHCPSCNTAVVAGNINLQNSVAKCSACNAIFSVHEQMERVKTLSESKQEVLRPEGIDLFYYKDDLDITIQHHLQGLDVFGLTIFPIVAVFLIFYYFMGEHSISPYFPIAFSMAAVYYIYRALNYSNNNTYIDVNSEYLKIKSRPKHFKKDKTYPVDQIDQVYIKQEPSAYYSINIVINDLNGQKSEKLLVVNTISKAKYLEQEIEQHLNIENRKVPESNV